MVLVLHGFRDKEAGSVEAGSYSRTGVNHAGFIDPLKGALLWMPLHCIKWVTEGFHGGDELLLSVIVSGEDFVKPLQLGVSAVVLH